MRFYTLSLLALALATPASAADQAKTEGTLFVAGCYQTCYLDLADRLEYRNNPPHDFRGRESCRAAHNIIVAASRCADACEAVWRTNGKPNVGVRKKFKAEVDRERTAYQAHTCATHPTSGRTWTDTFELWPDD